MEANLLVTFDPNHTIMASEEVKSLLKGNYEFFDSNVNGVFLVKTEKDPKIIVSELKELCIKNPEKFQYTFHWVPIEKWTKSEIDDIAEVIGDINNRLDSDKSWKMDLRKRSLKGDPMIMIMKLTELIDKRNVDLKSPEQIVKIEIMGDIAGISLLNSGELLDVPKIKQETE